MKDLVSNQLVRYLEARGVEHIFGLCGHTNIAVLAALEKSKKITFATPGTYEYVCLFHLYMKGTVTVTK